MSGKKSKKIRQIYRRDLAQKVKEMGQIIGNAMKPKPRWIPMGLWIAMASIFIKINKPKKWTKKRK